MNKTVKKMSNDRVYRNKNAQKNNKSMQPSEREDTKSGEIAHCETELCGFVPGHHMDDWL